MQIAIVFELAGRAAAARLAGRIIGSGLLRADRS
jgi:hypothetical protein